jgi:hypothetical protein
MKKQDNITTPKDSNSKKPNIMEVDEISGKEFKKMMLRMINKIRGKL